MAEQEPLVAFLRKAMKQVEGLESTAVELNYELKLSWNTRAKLSNTVGQIGRVAESLIELCDSAGTDASEALMEEWSK